MNKLLAALLLLYSMNAHAILICIDNDGTELRWQVGQYFDGLNHTPIFCLADGAELTHIRRQFIGIRIRSGTSTMGNNQVLWTGDDAQFIVDNL